MDVGSNMDEAMVVGDFNSDAVLDVGVTVSGGGNLEVFLGVGSAGVGFGVFSFDDSYVIGTGGRSIVAQDFDADGITDLAVGVYTLDVIAVLFGGGTYP